MNIGFTMRLIQTKSQMMIVWKNSGFKKNDIPRLVTALQLPDEIQCGIYHDLRVSSVEALCVTLKRLAFPCRYSDMMPRFARPVPQLSMICNETIYLLDSKMGIQID